MFDMENTIQEYKKTMEATLQSALEQQKRMNDEMGFETTEEDRQELIDDYARQIEQYEAMMRNQMQMQASMMAGMGIDMNDFAQMQAQAVAQAQAYSVEDYEDEDEEIDEEALKAFIEENLPPEEMRKYMMIGALLIGTNDEPYETLKLIDDKDVYLYKLEQGWGIDNREDTLEMIESLLNRRHTEVYDEDFALLQKEGTEGYFEKIDEDEAQFDEDTIEDYEAAVEAISEVLELPESYVNNCTTILAWDIDRVGLLARMCNYVGYITESEAYEFLKRAAVQVKENFKSWEDYFVSLLLGRSVAYAVSIEPFAVANDLLTERKDLLEKYPISSL